jgi:hypothetical protein
MHFILTAHAEKRCRKRGIRREWIARALQHPARTENDPEDPDLAQVLCVIPERAFRVLRVIYNETVDPVAIVTAYFDDEVRDL